MVGPGEDELGGGVRADAGLVEQLWREFAGERFDLACELALLGGQLQDPAGDRAECEQAAAQLGILAAVGRVAARRRRSRRWSAAAARCVAAPGS